MPGSELKGEPKEFQETEIGSNGLVSEVPGFDGHLENDNGFTGLQPATDVALATTTRNV
jgi:hypothetical protein